MKRTRFFPAAAFAAAVLVAGGAASLSSSSTPSSPEGVWIGTMTQPGGPYEHYLLRVEIRLEGTKITGTSRIEVPGTGWFGEMPIEGEIVGDSVRYTEGWMVAEKIPSEIAWCMKKAALQFIPSTDPAAVDSLIGPWESPPCLPGHIRLGRAPGESMTFDTASRDGRFRPDSGKHPD